MSSLLAGRKTYKPFSYQFCYDNWFKQQQAHWLHTEIGMSSDIQDWKLNLTEAEKNVVGGVLKGFIQTELIVNDYWTNRVAKWFPHPEIVMMSSAFGNMECFDKETELLTTDGWKYVNNLTINDKIAQFNIENREITFTYPLKLVSYDYNGIMHHYKGPGNTTDICITPNHDLILIHPGTKKIKKKKSSEGKWGRNFLYPSTGIGIGPENNLSWEEKLLIAIQADGCLRGNCPQSDPEWRTCDINITKERKILKLKEILNNSGVNYSERIRKDKKKISKVFTFIVPGSCLISDIKTFKFVEIENYSMNKAKEFIEELLCWDGNAKKRHWYNTNKLAVDKVQAIASLANISATIGINRTAEQTKKLILPQGGNPKTSKTCYLISFNDMVQRTYPLKKEIYYNGKVYCVSVPTQNLVSRRNGHVAITGNTIHTTAYAYLNDTLGIEDYDAFLQEPTAKAKIDRLTNPKGLSNYACSVADSLESTGRFGKEEKMGIAQSLAIFSAFTEGVSLFSSFAILFNFSRFNKMKGMGQIISFSVKDESLHSEAGCQLFRQFIKENPEVWTDELKRDIYEAARQTVALEDDFIDKVFELGPIEGLDPKDIKQFVRNRTNVKLGDLGLKTNWKNIDHEALKRMEWFDFFTVGVEHTDFFSQKPSAYSKPSSGFDDMF